jgi:hypothetical protein
MGSPRRHSQESHCLSRLAAILCDSHRSDRTQKKNNCNIPSFIHTMFFDDRNENFAPARVI